MLENIKAHSIVVARIAEFLAVGRGNGVSTELAVVAALLHDIGKTQCLHTDKNHAFVGRDICLSHGLDDVATIVAEHVILDVAFPEQEISAKEIVYYADKRVNHDQIVSLEERLAYIIDKYGKGNALIHEAIRRNFQRCFLIEEELFSRLDCRPEQLASFLDPQPVWLAGVTENADCLGPTPCSDECCGAVSGQRSCHEQ